MSRGWDGPEIIQLFGDANPDVWRSDGYGRAASAMWTRARWEPGEGRGGLAAPTPGMRRVVVNSVLCAHKNPCLHYGRVYKQINLLILRAEKHQHQAFVPGPSFTTLAIKLLVGTRVLKKVDSMFS